MCKSTLTPSNISSLSTLEIRESFTLSYEGTIWHVKWERKIQIKCLLWHFTSDLLLADIPWEGCNRFEGFKLNLSVVAVWFVFDKSVPSDVCIKVLWRLPADYAVLQGSSKFYSHDRKIHAWNAYCLCFSCVEFSSLAPSLGLQYPLACRKKKTLCKVVFSLAGHQSWSSFVGSSPRKRSPAEAHVYQTTWQCGVSHSFWRKSQGGGV